MTEGYEALRAQATGAADGTAHGLAVFVRFGLAAWMGAWRRLVGASGPPGRRPGARSPLPFRPGPELAVVLTEMALSRRRRLP